MASALTVIPFRFPGLETVRCAFGTCLGGEGLDGYGQGNISFSVGDDPNVVLANRERLLESLGLKAWACLKQVHGTKLVFEPGPTDIAADETEEADGLATSKPGMALAIKTADCQPVLLAHRDGLHIAALHVGWRGNRQEFIGKAVREFCDRYGLKPSGLMAVRGPSLGPGSSEFVHFDREFGPGYERYFNRETKRVNLWRLTRDQLMAAGLPEDAVFGLDLDTHALPSFYSFRRNRNTGRQVSLIWRE